MYIVQHTQHTWQRYGFDKSFIGRTNHYTFVQISYVTEAAAAAAATIRHNDSITSKPDPIYKRKCWQRNGKSSLSLALAYSISWSQFQWVRSGILPMRVCIASQQHSSTFSCIMLVFFRSRKKRSFNRLKLVTSFYSSNSVHCYLPLSFKCALHTISFFILWFRIYSAYQMFPIEFRRLN